MEPMARRFSDEELSAMHGELKDLSDRFDSHKLSVDKSIISLTSRFEKHVTDEAAKFDSMINAVNQNTQSIDKLTEETRSIVELHRDIQGTARIGKSVQNVLLWLVKWGAIGGAIAAVIRWALNYPST
jgi:hypothetical protein